MNPTGRASIHDSHALSARRARQARPDGRFLEGGARGLEGRFGLTVWHVVLGWHYV